MIKITSKHKKEKNSFPTVLYFHKTIFKEANIYDVRKLICDGRLGDGKRLAVA